ncbi:MAG: hypothetical protein M0R39_07670 [Prolixibacteraceae bacterium]|nr:hypothetical protein [Prolixibacteraceae bacterium]
MKRGGEDLDEGDDLDDGEDKTNSLSLSKERLGERESLQLSRNKETGKQGQGDQGTGREESATFCRREETAKRRGEQNVKIGKFENWEIGVAQS